MAKAEEAKKDGAGEEAAAPKKGGKKMLIIVVALVVVLLGGGGIAFAFMGGKKTDPNKVEQHVPVLKHALLESFMVNLGEASAFIKATILLEYDEALLNKVADGHGEGGGHAYGGGAGGGGGEAPNAVPAKMKAREPMIRDAVIRLFASKKTSEVLSPEGKDQLKDEMVEAINEALGFGEPVVTGVYFTEFIIQAG